MRRLSSTLTVMAAALLATTASIPPVLAQDGDATTAHAVVGAWWISPEGMVDSPSNLATFGADGTFVGVDPGGGVGIGSWRATAELTFEATFHFPMQDPEGRPVGYGTVFISGALSEDGETFTGTATTDLPTPDGGRSGPRGPTPLSGMRVTVEPMTPGSPLPEEPAAPAGSPMAPESSPMPEASPAG